MTCPKLPATDETAGSRHHGLSCSCLADPSMSEAPHHPETTLKTRGQGCVKSSLTFDWSVRERVADWWQLAWHTYDGERCVCFASVPTETTCVRVYRLPKYVLDFSVRFVRRVVLILARRANDKLRFPPSVLAGLSFVSLPDEYFSA